MMENANWDSILIASERLSNNSMKAEIENMFPQYTIVQAFSWFEVGRKITEEKPGFVLLDAELPGGNISEFLGTVKDDPFFGKPFVFLAGNERTEDGSAAKADLILSKPIDMKKIEATIKSFEKNLDAAVTA